MTKHKLPRARNSAFLIIGIGIVALSLWSYLGWYLHNTILAAGLFLDVIGAIILAIPDIPLLQQRFFSGMVQCAVDHLKLERGTGQNVLIKPGTDEKSIDSLYIVEDVSGEAVAESSLLENVVRRPEPSTKGFYELRESFQKGTNDSLWNHVFGFKVYEKDGDWRTYIMYNRDGDPDVKLKSSYQSSFARIENKLRDSEARFRRMGLSLLIAGFLFQGISLVI